MADQLPPRLNEVLEEITDHEFSTRLRRVIEAAAQAIDQLGAMSLVKLEPAAAEEGSADLSLWEQMAPAVRDTVVDVNALLQVIDAEFPDSAVQKGELPTSSDDRSEAEAGRVFRAVAGRLERDVTEVGGMMRNPELVGSRWALLGELQRLRAGFRATVGDAVYLSAAACAPVGREEVVPGFAQELTRAALFRSTTADVRRNVAEKLGRQSVAPKQAAKQIEGDFEIFGTLPAWRHVRAEPKRQMLQVREALRKAAGDDALTREGLSALVTPALSMLKALVEEQSRALLPTHDRFVRNLAGRLLEQAVLHLELDTGAAEAAFARAISACEGLYGREEGFDTLVRSLRARSADELTPDELKARALKLSSVLAGLQL